MSFKEQKEYENLGAEIEVLEKKKAILVEKMNAGEGSHEELAAWAKEFEEFSNLIEEKEFRWLELAEMA
jgi:ATP-binding cassette subfamily F protein uup